MIATAAAASAASAPNDITAAAAGQPASPTCQRVLDLWCSGLQTCSEEIKAAGQQLPLIARYGLNPSRPPSGAEWRCYTPSVLDASRSRCKTAGCDGAFCSHPDELATVLGICNGTLPDAPYPLPGNGTVTPSPPPADCAGDPGAPHETTAVMSAGQDSVDCFRIPTIVGPFPPHSTAVLAFAEAREKNCGDSGLHAMAFSRSPDGGRTWPDKIQYLWNDTNPDRDGFNLGASVYDSRTKTVHVMFNECADAYGKAPCGPTAELLLLSSPDFGLTWLPYKNLTKVMVAAGFAMLNPGPGTGIQTAGGRLVVPAWGAVLGTSDEVNWNSVVLYSDDGSSWHISSKVPNADKRRKPNELQAAALPNGTIVLNIRDDSTPYRLISTSDDNGSTWLPMEVYKEMVLFVHF
jgi:hypothetical protein